MPPLVTTWPYRLLPDEGRHLIVTTAHMDPQAILTASRRTGMTTLEDEMAALLSLAGGIQTAGAEVNKTASKVRRKSKDLQDQLADMAGAEKSWEALGNRSRRGSRDYSDDNLEATFAKWDKDGSGSIDLEELGSAVREIEPNISDAGIAKMMEFADEDETGCISLDEFKKVMLKKPE